jgi:hypothetical protein
MNEFSLTDRLKRFAVAAVVAAVAVPLSFVLWQTPPGVATPPASMLPLFVPIGIVIPSLSLGLGVAFLLFGRRLLRSDGAPFLSRATYLSIGWLLANWWPHANFHRVASGWANLLLVDYFFHTTVIIATLVVAAYFLTVVREQRGAGQIETSTHGVASTSSA